MQLQFSLTEDSTQLIEPITNKRIKDLTGRVFGRWTVIAFSHVSPNRDAIWLCRCECGNERTVKGFQMKNGRNRSCGCLQRELAAQKKRTHGLTHHPLRYTYHQMIYRCSKPTHGEYHNYGARGITVCERWRDGFANFLADMGERPEGYTLDRIDNNGPYSPENCRWATSSQQSNNSRRNHTLTYDGRTMTITEWARELNMPPNTIRSRLRLGWSVERILTEPVNPHPRHKS